MDWGYRFQEFWPRMRVQPVCAPRKARPLPRLWSDHGWVPFCSVRRACDRWCKYYNCWSYILYREFQKGKPTRYVRMLVMREIRQHNGANCYEIPTTYTERGYYLQQSGGSRWLLALESMLYVHCDYGPIGPYSQFIIRTRLKEKGRTKTKEKKRKRKNPPPHTAVNNTTSNQFRIYSRINIHSHTL